MTDWKKRKQPRNNRQLRKVSSSNEIGLHLKIVDSKDAVALFHFMMTTKTLQGECSINAFGIEPAHQRSNQLSRC